MSSGEPSAQPDQIGKYRIVGTLGQGAMGRVYLGEDPHIGRKVAVKVLSGATGEEARARFLEEARTIGHLSHPEIVTLLEFGFHEGQPFLAMEHLEGESFGRWLARRPPEAAVLGVLAALCRAIDHAHAHGVLHRDVKPSNLQVLDDGRAKLLDFGIARAGSAALTATGMLMGTPQYLAPEVLEGKGHSTASDVYAVGLVAYEALTGTNPFAADTLEHCLTRVLTASPEPLAVLRPDLEPELADAVRACLARTPADRPATLEPLRRALETRIASGSDSLAQPTVRLQRGPGTAPGSEGASARPDAAVGSRPAGSRGRRRPGWSRWAMGAAGAIALLGAAGVLAWRLAGPAATAPPTASPPAPRTADVGTTGARGPETTAPAPNGADAEDLATGAAQTNTRTDQATGRRDTDTASRGRIDQPAEPSATGDADERSREPVAAPPIRDRASTDPGPSATPSDERTPTAAGGPASPDSNRTAEARTIAEPEARPDRSADAAAAETTLQAPSGPGAPVTGPPAATAGPETLPTRESTTGQESEDGARQQETARPEPAPRLDRLTPAVVRRGGVATVVLEGAAFADGLAVEVRRGDTAVPGIRVRRLAVRDDGRIRLTLFVAPDVPLGLYSVVVVAPDGRTSNPTELEVTL